MVRDLYFVGNKLLIQSDEQTVRFSAPAHGSAAVETYRDFDGCDVSVHDIKDDSFQPAEGQRLADLRDFFDLAGAMPYTMAQRAFQILNWRRDYRFCGHCGTPLARKESRELAMHCPHCNRDFYPRLNPAVIMRVVHDDRILLARRGPADRRVYSVLAGFVEAGENLEDAVVREVKEEVGLDIARVRYLKSQPWPFPNNLMLGFEAEAANTDIALDHLEVFEAGWFERDHLPAPLPGKVTIARWLIDTWIDSPKAP